MHKTFTSKKEPNKWESVFYTCTDSESKHETYTFACLWTTGRFSWSYHHHPNHVPLTTTFSTYLCIYLVLFWTMRRLQRYKYRLSPNQLFELDLDYEAGSHHVSHISQSLVFSCNLLIVWCRNQDLNKMVPFEAFVYRNLLDLWTATYNYGCAIYLAFLHYIKATKAAPE